MRTQLAVLTTRPAAVLTATSPRRLPSNPNKELSQMLSVGVRDGSLMVQGGRLLVQGLSQQTFLTKADSGAVLGLHSPLGPVSIVDVNLGQLVCNRFLACARNKLWWMTPEWGTSALDLPPETQFLLLELSVGGPYAVLLPLIDDGAFRATLRPPTWHTTLGPATLVLRVESGDVAVTGDTWEGVLYAAGGWDPFELVDRAVAAAAARSGGARPLADKELPATLDLFGFCTWDAFYSKVSASGISRGLESLADAGVPPRFLIIDDGWQVTEAAPGYEQQEDTAAVLADGVPLSSAPATMPLSDELPPSVQESTRPHLPAQRSMFAWLHEWVAHPKAALLHQVALLVNWSAAYPWVARIVGAAAAGPMRSAFMQYFADAGDHIRRLSSVKANAKFSSTDAGPEHGVLGPGCDMGLAVRALKQAYGLQYVYCWHAMAAYWAGISPTAPDMAAYRPTMVLPKPTPGVLEVDPSMAWNPQTLAGCGVAQNCKRLYADMHDYLQGCGVDGVKVDVQATAGLLGGPALAQAFHISLEESVKEHFPGNHCINCMALSTENIYRARDTAVTRASDDFYPTDPASHTSHIAICASNSVFLGALFQPDWDMFHSDHPAAMLHAVARVVSGGAVYVSDPPGRHGKALLKRLVLPNGSVLRALRPGRPTRDTLFCNVLADCKTLLKVWNVNAYSGVVGVFNVQGSSWSRFRRRFVIHDAAPPQLQAEVHPIDVEDFNGGRQREVSNGQGHHVQSEFAIFSDKCSNTQLVAANEALAVTLKAGECDILTVAPIVEVGGVKFAPVGLVNMLNPGGAVESVTCKPPAKMLRDSANDVTHSCGTQAVVHVRGCGKFLAYASQQPVSCKLNELQVPFEYDDSQSVFTFVIPTKGTALRSCLCVSF